MKRIESSLVLLAGLLSSAPGADKKAAQTYGIVGGTVFREPGYALPGAEVTVEADPQDGQTAGKIKKMHAVSDARGEFAFRVPPTPMRYVVKVAVKGFNRDQKQVSINGEERSDATFMLHAESK